MTALAATQCAGASTFSSLPRVERQGVAVRHNTHAAFAKLIREDHQRWAKLVKDAGIVLR